MEKIKSISSNLIFSIQVLLTFLLFFGDHVQLPLWLQVAGRLHPVILHLPIGLWILFFAMTLVRKNEHLERRTYETIIFTVLLFTSLTASVTALLGFLLSAHGDYGSDSIARHKVSGFILSWLCYLILTTYHWQKERAVIFYGLNSMTLLAVIFAGHTGATLTHGENFVFEPLTRNQKNTLSLETSTVYELSAHLIFEKKCFSCHNETKAKGGLVMTSIEQFEKGGKHGTVFKAGKPDESNLIKAIELPITEDHHMPPDGKTQLTPEEIRVIRHWIKSGADFEKKLTDLSADDSLRFMTVALIATEMGNTKERTYPFQQAAEDLIAKLNSPFMTLAPLSANSPALRADFYVSASFNPKTLESLDEVSDQLVELNLSHMPVTEKELNFIGNFRNLEKLNLNFTNVSDDLIGLKKLSHLKSISLSGTHVTSNSLNQILSLPELKEVFAWNTSVSSKDQLIIQKKYPSLAITWEVPFDNKPLKLSMPALVHEDVLKKNENMILKHPMPGTMIRYTLDGTTPDSVRGNNYTEPFRITGTTMLKAYAFKEGWLKSDVYEVICFTEGMKPFELNLLTKPDPQYPGEGASSLVDGRKGNADQFKESSWLGFRNNPFAAEFYFPDTVPSVKSITISYGKNTRGYIFPPAKVEVWAGPSKQKVSLIKTINVTQPTANHPVKVEALIIPLTKAKFNYYKLICTPVSKLPKWHSGKGEKGWFFVDEVFFN
jgi:hypothetical protein